MWTERVVGGEQDGEIMHIDHEMAVDGVQSHTCGSSTVYERALVDGEWIWRPHAGEDRRLPAHDTAHGGPDVAE